MSNPGKLFVSANTKQGRRIAASTSPLHTGRFMLTAEQKAWNDQVTMRNRKKLIAKLERTAQAQIAAHAKAHNITQGDTK